jgi:hypothetical protein
MGNLLFSTNLTSSFGRRYKVDLFGENYIGFDAAIIGGSGSYYYFAGDWTDFVNVGDDMRIYEGAIVSGNRVVSTVEYNAAQNRTEIQFTVGSYNVAQTRVITLEAAPSFEPDILNLQTEWDNQGDIILESIKSSSTTITYANNSAFFDRFIDMYIESDDDELKLIVYRDNSGWVLDWVGNIVIDLVEWDNVSKPTPFTIKAIDGLDKLKDIRYDEVATSPTETKLKEHIYNLLSKNNLAQFWGASDAYLRESIEYVSNQVSGTVTDSTSPLDYCYISDRMFINKEPNDNDDEGVSCYDALRGILELFNCRIFLSKGVYYIQQVRNYDNNTVIVYREYAKTMGTYARGTYNFKLTAGGTDRADDLVVLGGGKFAYLPGLYRTSMEVKSNVQSEVKMPVLSIENGQNPDTFTETFDVYGGVGSGAFISYGFDVYTRFGIAIGDYLYLKIEMYGTTGGTTYYLSGGLGAPMQWVTTPYSKLYYDYRIQGGVVGGFQKFSLQTPEIPFSGTLTVVITGTMKSIAGGTVTPVAGTEPFQVASRLLIPLGDSSNNTLVEADNPASNYTKQLNLPSLIITDFSNSTSLNVISVKSDYLTTNTTLVKTVDWSAGFDADFTLTETRVLEAMSLQYRPISRYLGSFEGNYYPHNCITYNSKTYFFNGFLKNYAMDEVNGEWIEQTNKKAGATPTVFTGNPTEGEIYTGDGNQSSMVAMLNNNHVISYINSAVSAGSTITSLTIVATGITATAKSGDTIIIIDPITNGIIETFELTADILSIDTTISVVEKTTDLDIEVGMVFQLNKASYFSKLNA